MTLNNGMSESSGCMSNTSVQLVWRESVKQLSTTPLNSDQARKKKKNMAAPVHRNTAREKDVNYKPVILCAFLFNESSYVQSTDFLSSPSC